MVMPPSLTRHTTKGYTMISTQSKALTVSDLSRAGLMWIIGWLEITPLVQTLRMDSALAAMEAHLSTWPEDLDRYVLDTPASEYRAVTYPPVMRSVDLADYRHAGFKVAASSTSGDWHNANRTDLP